MSLAAVIVNPSLMIRDYKTEYIVYFLPVLEQEMIIQRDLLISNK